ncbi:flagellar protein FliS [Planktomarina sp.]|jgi:flagellar secretion chaperone FliS|uniref:flagellar protein FliS n=1 Tax=uncultured Planktomarina sp. TaxID=1538529 RepID=UPI00237510DF|nr:flagellar protein FliS [Planktomarina sp.]
MNTQAAISSYTEIKSQTLSHESVGYNVVSAALNKLEVNLKSLVSSTHKQERKKAFETALLTLYFLQKSLDFKSQGNLAINLYRLYEFCRIKLLEIGIDGSSNNDEIKKCHSFINEIRVSWDSVRDK